jgi:hypothetical protein
MKILKFILLGLTLITMMEAGQPAVQLPPSQVVVELVTDKWTKTQALAVQMGRPYDGAFGMLLMALPGHPASYQLTIYTAASEWLFIPEGQTVSFLADGVLISLSGEGSLGDRDIDNSDPSGFIMLREGATYRITREQIKLMALAKDLQLRIRGDKGVRELVIDKLSQRKLFTLLTILPPSLNWKIEGNKLVGE